MRFSRQLRKSKSVGLSTAVSMTLCSLSALASISPTELSGLSVEKAIAALEDTGLVVFYSSDLIKPWMRVDETLSATEPVQMLAEILTPLGLTTQPGPEGSLLIIRDPAFLDASVDTGGIAGIVREPAEGEPVPGAAVSLYEPLRRAVTGRDGRFVFGDLPEGSYTLRVLYPINSYEAVEEIEVTAKETTVTFIDVDTSLSTRLEEIVVAASQYELTRAVGESRTLLTNEDIEYMPDFGDDALRAMSRLPGTTTNGVSATSNVRGGEVGETLVRFDNLRLYDPFHMKDFQSIFSTVDPRIVSSMDIYTGGFPAAFGDRMSSVVDVVSLTPPSERYHEIAMSFFNASILSSGRFGDDGEKGEWLASIRRSNLDVLYGAYSKQIGEPRYVDGFAKVGYQVNDSLRVTGNYLYFADDIFLRDAEGDKQAKAKGDDSYFWLRFDHTPHSRFTGATLLAHSKLTNDRSGFTIQPGISTGTLVDQRSSTIYSLQSDWSSQLSDQFLFQFGGTVSRMSGWYNYQDEVAFDVLFDLPGAPAEASRSRDIRVTPRADQYSLYGNVRYNPTARLTADFGLRWDKQTLDPNHTGTLGPRIGLRYQVGDRTYLRGSWGRFYQSQAINELQVEDGVQQYFAPQRSDHTVLGLEHDFSQGLNLRVEAYDKTMTDLRPRYENLLNSLTLLPELKPDRIAVAPGSARARGVEVFLSQRLQYPVTWWFGYSWSWVKDLVDGERFFRSWDQTHAVSAGLNWDTPKWNVGFGLIYRSGWPTTPVTLDDSGPTPIVEINQRNSDRVDFYRSADLRVTRKFELDSSSVSVFLEITNLFGRHNPCCIEYEILPIVEGGGLERETLDYLPTIPSLGFIWNF